MRARQTLGRAVTSDLRKPAAAHYDVLALRVEFQPDTTRFTSGIGTFGGGLYDGGLSPNIDPFPHDAGYFQAHLDFLADYVERVSDGKTTVDTHLLPVVQVSKPMGAYSPTGFEAGGDQELKKLAVLIEEAWSQLDPSLINEFLPGGVVSPTTVLVLFHAGVGRDIELIGTTLDKTPQDLPSLFFDSAAFERILGRPAQTGNGLVIDHTLLLPRTETRQGFDYIQDQPFLAEFSINGLLAASFFNFLGVPDLFNTETGESAIGPFGLMDPLGIFAFNGLFPPEPSAWTKYYLGWTEPVALSRAGPETVSLSAVASRQGSDVARVPVSEAEYYLVENRHRDPEGDGLVMRIWKDGAVTEQRVQNGDENFNSFITSGFNGGVVVGVDNYDWALPGGLDEDDNDLNGGLLIWHVDERRMAAGLADNSVNADPKRRALDLEEADSAQDLGFPSSNPFGPAFDLGSPFDFFYEGNPVVVINQAGQEVRLYQNRFGPDTYPNSHSNEGGDSFVVIEGFTAPAETMSFSYRKEGRAGIVPVPALSGVDLSSFQPFNEKGKILRLQNQGTAPDLAVSTGPSPRPAEEQARGWPQKEPTITLYVEEFTGEPWGSSPCCTGPIVDAEGFNWILELTLDPNKVSLYAIRERQTTNFRAYNISVPQGVVEPLMFLGAGTSSSFHVRRVKDEDEPRETNLLTLLPDGTASFSDFEGGDILSLASDGSQVALVGRSKTVVEGSGVGWTYSINEGTEVGQAVFGRDASGLVGVIPVTGGDALLFLLADGSVRQVNLGALFGANDLSAYPVLVDLDNDLRLDVLTTYGTLLVAFTQGGAVVDGFPITMPSPASGQPLVAALSDSGGWSVVTSALNGYVYAFDLGRRGDQVDGFPLAVGDRVETTPLLDNGRLYAVSEEGRLYAWALENLRQIWWGQLYGNAQNQSYVELPIPLDLQVPPEGLLVEGEVYNWPNPIRSGSTNLRFRPTKPCRVEITIIDAAGALVDKLLVENVPGGVPTEVRWETNAASGLYFARVKATADDGETQSKMIKMAVIR